MYLLRDTELMLRKKLQDAGVKPPQRFKEKSTRFWDDERCFKSGKICYMSMVNLNT